MLDVAPPELRKVLQTPFHLDRWLVKPSPRAIQQRFLTSRCISYKGHDVIMPIVELANHGYASQYDLEGGVGLGGTFPDEILVRYAVCDPLEIFDRWGFASEGELFALSLQMGLKNLNLLVGRRPLKIAAARKPFFPDVSMDGNLLKQSYMLLGHRNFPRLPRGNFYQVMRDAGRSDAEEAFDAIQHVNRMQFYRLLQLSELAEPALRRLLRNVVRCQLEAMSHSVGTRDV
jgi:hypothetical protein